MRPNLVEETEVPEENHRPDATHWQTYVVPVLSTPRLSNFICDR
jgi:hypothetical protein